MALVSLPACQGSSKLLAGLLFEAGWELAAEPHQSFTDHVVPGKPV